MKRTLASLLALAMLLTLLPLGAVSVSALKDGKYTFLLNEDEKSVTITAVDEDIAGRVVIPSMLHGYPVTAIGESAFFRCWDMTSVVIPEGIKTIGAEAFSRLNITSATLPKGLVTIGDSAFYQCTDLKTINIPDTVTTIGASAFSWCGDLESVTIPRSVTSMGEMVFAWTGLKSINVPNTIQEVPNSLFSGCESLKSVTIEKGITKIGYSAFNNCDALVGIEIPASVIELGDYVFADCDALEKMTVPGTVKTVGFRAFSDCENLTEAVLKTGITSLPSHLFLDCENLKKVSLPSTVNVIGNSMFDGCQALTEISFGKNIKEIGTQAFEYCDHLTDVWFAGSKADREKIDFGYGNDALEGAIWHYDCYPFEIVSQPKTVYAKEGATVNAKIEATGEGLKYQWYYKNAGASTYTKSGLTKATYSTDMVDKSNGRTIYCVITDKNGNTLQSDPILLRRQATITKEPATYAYAKNGAKMTVKITAMGDGLKYQWYVKSTGSSTYKKSAVTSATYSATMGSAAKNRKVYCVVTDKYGKKDQSKTFTLRESVSITKQPATYAYAKKGAKVSVKIAVSGDGLKYQWYVKNAGSSTYKKSSITTNTYSATMGSAAKNRKVYCVITDKYGKKVQTKTFTLREAASVTMQPKSTTVKKNTTAKATVKASGDGLKYTWYIKNAGSSKYTKSSITSATYSVKMTSKVKGRRVYCVVTDKYGNKVQTQTVILKMK